MPPTKTAACSVCKAPMWKTKHLASVPCCMDCRRTLSRDEKAARGIVNPRARRPRAHKLHPLTCEQCGADFTSRRQDARFCSMSCVGDSQRIRPDDDRRVQRWKRDQRAPGISTHQRGRLLAKWKRQGRACYFCPATADTVDHLLPLVRGGSNYEGNLVPACRQCNSAKSSRTIMEWRTGRTPGHTISGSAELLPEPHTRPTLRLVRGSLKTRIRA